MDKNLKLILKLFLFGISIFSIENYGKDKSNASPEELIKSLYAKHSEAKPIDICNQNVIQSFFEKNLIKLVSKDCSCKKKTGEICKLSFDPFIGGQEFLEPNLKPKIKKKTETVYEVSIYDSNPITLQYEIIQSNDGYRITDIKNGSDSLLGILK